MSESDYARARHLIHHAQRIMVFSGAGLSRASGIPTYRDANSGLWTQGNNAQYSSVHGMRADPKGFEAFWQARLAELSDARPNNAHAAIAALQAHKPETIVATQNVDGLLTQAGCGDVVELHGNAHRLRCKGCGRKQFLLGRCIRCGGKGRPDVILFGETLEAAKVKGLLSALETIDLVLIVGSTLEVYPAASIPEKACARNIPVIMIDPNPPALWEFAVSVLIRDTAELALPKLLEINR